jgi:ribonuclease P protein component
MISRIHRFHGHASLKYLHRNAKTVRGVGLLLKYVPNPKRTTYRAAIIVSRKVHKSAVVRNRIRRRLYESVRILSTDFSEVYDLAFLIHDEHLATIPYDNLVAEVVKMLQKAQITIGTEPKRAIVKTKEV